MTQKSRLIVLGALMLGALVFMLARIQPMLAPTAKANPTARAAVAADITEPNKEPQVEPAGEELEPEPPAKTAPRPVKTWTRDPFKSAIEKPKPPPKADKPKIDLDAIRKRYSLTGIMGGADSYCILNGNLVGVGDTVGGMKIKEILDNSIILEGQDVSVDIPLKQ